MRYIVYTFLMCAFAMLAGCDAVNPFSPETITMEKLVSDVSHGDGNEYVGKTIKVEAEVERIGIGEEDCYELFLESPALSVWVYAQTCDDTYQEGETYTFTLYIKIVDENGYGGYRIESDIK